MGANRRFIEECRETFPPLLGEGWGGDRATSDIALTLTLSQRERGLPPADRQEHSHDGRAGVETIFGLKIIDLAVVVGYFALVMAIGFWASTRVHTDEDFFLGGRRFGKGLLV